MPSVEPDPYSVLNVPRSATAREIRAAYRALVARYHPDRHQGNPLEDLAAARMAEVNHAYDLLSDAKRRAAFDAGTFDPSSSHSRPNRAAAEAQMGKRFIKGAALLLVLPVILRLGAGIVRLLGLLVRTLFESLSTMRGPRLAAVVAVVGLIAIVIAVRRRGRR